MIVGLIEMNASTTLGLLAKDRQRDATTRRIKKLLSCRLRRAELTSTNTYVLKAAHARGRADAYRFAITLLEQLTELEK